MAYTQLTETERYPISSLREAGFSQLFIAESLKRSPSTISRELKRNQEVQTYCPEQVADYLKQHKGISLHHETIYRLIYQDKREGGDLWQHLRIARKPYRKRYGRYERRGKIKNRVSIDERPEIVDKKERIGDWEGDTIIGKDKKSALLTWVDRKTLYTIIVKLDSKQASEVAKAAVKVLYPLKQKVKTITFDNGLEFADHEIIGEELETQIYFAHPYSPWERGINENINGLIRQYFPKGTNFNEISDQEINFVVNRLNNRPRKTRGGKTPNELFKGIRTCLLPD